MPKNTFENGLSMASDLGRLTTNDFHRQIAFLDLIDRTQKGAVLVDDPEDPQLMVVKHDAKLKEVGVILPRGRRVDLKLADQNTWDENAGKRSSRILAKVTLPGATTHRRSFCDVNALGSILATTRDAHCLGDVRDDTLTMRSA